MPQIKDIFEKENERLTSGDMNAVYLYPEGTFYRAYEWSAWLCCRYISQFKATRREIKSESGQTMVFVGFPTTSLTKFVPDEAETVINDDKSVAIFLPKKLFAETDNADLLQKEFEHWKESVPLASSRRGSLKEELKTSEHPQRMSEIMFSILAFPLEQKSPMDCMNFIAELKRQITALL